MRFRKKITAFYTVTFGFNEGLRDSQGMFAITRFIYTHFTIAETKDIVRYTEDVIIEVS